MCGGGTGSLKLHAQVCTTLLQENGEEAGGKKPRLEVKAVPNDPPPAPLLAPSAYLLT